MTHMDTILITLMTLMVTHWIAAYFVCRWDYRSGSGSDGGLGVLWIPIIGWGFLWFLAIGGLIMWFGSAQFKRWFYGRHGSKSKAALRDVIGASNPNTIGAITQRVTNGLIINGLVTRSFPTHYTIWKKS
jgi:hypothetical protein